MRLSKMKRKRNNNNNYSECSKRYIKQNYANDDEASTSTNIHFVMNEFEELNTEINTGIRNKFIRLSSSHNIDEETSIPYSEQRNLSSIEESNFHISNSFFFFPNYKI